MGQLLAQMAVAIENNKGKEMRGHIILVDFGSLLFLKKLMYININITNQNLLIL